MANSFGDQLLKAGLVSRDKLNKAKKSKYKQQKTAKKSGGDVSEATESARRVAAEKAVRDRELNRQQRETIERKAVQAQIRQLIEMNHLPRDDGEVGYNFQDGTSIKTLFVSEQTHSKLGRGQLAIVRFDDGYEVIPSAVAGKITLRDASCIVSSAPAQLDDEGDDSYADYKIPDDLMW